MRQNPEWDLLTGITPLKTPDCEPNIYREDTPGAYWDWTFGEVFPIDACGMSCVMIRRSAFEKVGEPWFGWESGHKNGDYVELGEDIGFCTKLREAGGVLMADGNLLCGHMDKEGRMFQLSDQSAPFKRGREALERATRVPVV
jgi:GT2 family glycosyltransferase